MKSSNDNKNIECLKGLQTSETIKIVINDTLVEMYNNLYFEEHPRRRKPPIDKCIPPSLNQWINMNRQQYNNLKQKWSDFIIWVVEQYGLSNKGIERCSVKTRYYFATRHRRDLTNFVFKIIEDGLVNSGLFIDDNMNVINPLSIEGYYDKENTRMEIIIEVLE